MKSLLVPVASVLFASSAMAAPCVTATFSGHYLFEDQGHVVGVGPYASVGRVTANGLGVGTIVQTTSVNGTVSEDEVQFFYTVSAQCKAEATTSAGRHFTLYFDSPLGANATFLATDPGTVIKGTLKRGL
jgi:hypothetical protein